MPDACRLKAIQNPQGKIRGRYVSLSISRPTIQASLSRYRESAADLVLSRDVMCSETNPEIMNESGIHQTPITHRTTYAYSALGYASKASQNLHIVLPRHMDPVRVDLQDVSDIPGYDCLSEVERLGAKSRDRSMEPGAMKPIQI